MLTVIKNLLCRFTEFNLRYCHWKSNLRLERSLSGKGDIDLIIHRTDGWKAIAILGEMRFKESVILDNITFPSMQHFYGLDEQTGVIVHVHLYFEIITGESLLKNYRLPLADMLFQHLRDWNGVMIPTKSAELVIFVIRMMLKQAVLVEHALVYLEYEEVLRELRWLLEEDTVDGALALLEEYFPAVSPALFKACLVALSDKREVLRRYLLGKRLQNTLAAYSRYPKLIAMILNNYRFMKFLWRYRVLKLKNQGLASGGLALSVVGPQQQLNDQIISELGTWLGANFAIRLVRGHEPLPGWITTLAHVPALEGLLGVILAARLRWLSRRFARQAINGVIVLRSEKRLAIAPPDDIISAPDIILQVAELATHDGAYKRDSKVDIYFFNSAQPPQALTLQIKILLWNIL